MTWLRGGRWTAGNRPEPSRTHGRGRSLPHPSLVPFSDRFERRRHISSLLHAFWRTPPFPICDSPRSVWWARGRERSGPTRSHPEPGRDPLQRRRVLWTWSMGGEAAASPPDPPDGNCRRQDQIKLFTISDTERSSNNPPHPNAVAFFVLALALRMRCSPSCLSPLPKDYL